VEQRQIRVAARPARIFKPGLPSLVQNIERFRLFVQLVIRICGRNLLTGCSLIAAA